MPIDKANKRMSGQEGTSSGKVTKNPTGTMSGQEEMSMDVELYQIIDNNMSSDQSDVIHNLEDQYIYEDQNIEVKFLGLSGVTKEDPVREGPVLYDCQPSCRLKCKDRMPTEERLSVYHDFHSIEGSKAYYRQKLWVSQYCYLEKSTKRGVSKDTPPRIVYRLPKEDKSLLKVCRIFWNGTLGWKHTGGKIVRSALWNIDENGTPKDIMRGLGFRGGRKERTRKKYPKYCEKCGKYFASSWNLAQHHRTVCKSISEEGIENDQQNICDVCGKQFHQSWNLKRHYQTVCKGHIREATQTDKSMTSKGEKIITGNKRSEEN